MNKTMKKYRQNCIFAFLVILLSISPLTIGAGQVPIPDAYQVSKTAPEKLRTLITYSCIDSPIETVLMDLAEQAKIDIIKSPKVTGKVTAKVTNVPLAEALKNILAAHEWTYIATENMIRVVPLPKIALARDEPITRVYRVTYADVNEVAVALGNFVSERGSVAFNKGTSHIVVTETESKIKAIDKFIEQIDRITPQVLVEVRIFEVITKEGFELSPDWRAGRNAPYTGDLITLPGEVITTETQAYTVTEDVNRLDDRTVGGFPTDYKEWKKEQRLERVDTHYPATKETETRYTDLPAIMTNLRRKPFAGGSFDRIRGGTLSFGVLNDAVDIDLALTILQTQVETKLLANPRVLVLDNETANFEIVREIPYRELRQVGREDPITYTEFKNVGVNLKVTPHIARDGMIRLHIVPEFGVLVSQNIEGVPTVDTRRADTVTLIKDGQTIALGGLRQRQNSKYIAKVPVLGDIPLVGRLFQSESESVKINELLVFITTRIITEPELSEVEQARADEIEKVLSGDNNKSQKVINSSDPEIMISQAVAALKSGRYSSAKQLLTTVTQLQPGNSTAYQYLGYCHLRLDEADKAIESYNKAIEINAKDWQAHRGLGVAYMLKALDTQDEALKAKALQQWHLSLDINPEQPKYEELLKLIRTYSK